MPVKQLEFHAHDVREALAYLQSIYDSGGLSGIIFAAQIKRRKGLLYGSTGSLADNDIMTAGAAVKLLASTLKSDITDNS